MLQIPFAALADVGLRETRFTSRVGDSGARSGALLVTESKANQPIEDKVEISRQDRLQEQLLRGLNIRYSYARTPVEITAQDMEDVMAQWASKANLSLADVEIMAVAYAYAQDNGYDISNAIQFENNYSFWAGVNRHTIGDRPAGREDRAFAYQFIGSTAFETSRLPKDFLLMSFDPLHPTAKGRDARFVADMARYLSDAPQASFDSDAQIADILFQDYRARLGR